MYNGSEFQMEGQKKEEARSPFVLNKQKKVLLASAYHLKNNKHDSAWKKLSPFSFQPNHRQSKRHWPLRATGRTSWSAQPRANRTVRSRGWPKGAEKASSRRRLVTSLRMRSRRRIRVVLRIASPSDRSLTSVGVGPTSGVTSAVPRRRQRRCSSSCPVRKGRWTCLWIREDFFVCLFVYSVSSLGLSYCCFLSCFQTDPIYCWFINFLVSNSHIIIFQLFYLFNVFLDVLPGRKIRDVMIHSIIFMDKQLAVIPFAELAIAGLCLTLFWSHIIMYLLHLHTKSRVLRLVRDKIPQERKKKKNWPLLSYVKSTHAMNKIVGWVACLHCFWFYLSKFTLSLPA